MAHLESLKTALGCSSADIWNMLGQNRARATLRESELVTPAIGMQVRLLRDHPEYARIPKPVYSAMEIIDDVADRLEKHPICTGLTAKGRARLVVSMLGIHPTRAARLSPDNWRGSGAVGPAATRLLQLYLDQRTDADKHAFIYRWVESFNEELAARGKSLAEVTKKGWAVRTRTVKPRKTSDEE